MNSREQDEIPKLALTAIYKIIKAEGGFVYTNHPVDPDQGTYTGIRYKTFVDYMLHYDTNGDDTSLTPKEFKELAQGNLLNGYILRIYYQLYFLKMELLRLPTRLIMPVFSCGVNCGTSKGIKILQKTCNELNVNNISLKVDGINGPKTANLVNKLCIHIDDTDMENSREFTNEFRNNFIKNWIHYYIKVVDYNHDDAVFILGWFNRANKYWVKQCG